MHVIVCGHSRRIILARTACASVINGRIGRDPDSLDTRTRLLTIVLNLKRLYSLVSLWYNSFK